MHQVQIISIKKKTSERSPSTESQQSWKIVNIKKPDVSLRFPNLQSPEKPKKSVQLKRKTFLPAPFKPTVK
jgi:hypothetical protein